MTADGSPPATDETLTEPTTLPPAPERRTWRGRIWRWLLRPILSAGLFYVTCVLLGLIPTNNQFRQPDEGITIYVTSSDVHADLVLPVQNDVVDWRQHFPAEHFRSPIGRYSHVAIGWGDRGFYLETPTWEQFRLSTAAHALLWPSESVLHVHYQWRPKQTADQRAVRISQQQYQQLVEYILASVRSGPPDDKPLHIPGYAYTRRDTFYRGRGKYHLFGTCNCWVADGLQHVGVRVPWFSPLPRTVLWYLP